MEMGRWYVCRLTWYLCELGIFEGYSKWDVHYDDVWWTSNESRCLEMLFSVDVGTEILFFVVISDKKYIWEIVFSSGYICRYFNSSYKYFFSFWNCSLKAKWVISVDFIRRIIGRAFQLDKWIYWYYSSHILYIRMIQFTFRLYMVMVYGCFSQNTNLVKPEWNIFKNILDDNTKLWKMKNKSCYKNLSW